MTVDVEPATARQVESAVLRLVVPVLYGQTVQLLFDKKGSHFGDPSLTSPQAFPHLQERLDPPEDFNRTVHDNALSVF